MKGITPIIATIILLLITIGIASAAYTYIAGYWSGTASGVLELVDQFCNSEGNATIILRNVGTKNISISSISVVSIDGHVIIKDWSSETIQPQSTVTFTDDNTTCTMCSYRFIPPTGPAVQVTIRCEK